MSYSILIIDDDSSFKKILEIRLKTLDEFVEIVNFENLENARDFLKANNLASYQKINFDMVILDQHLPDGFGVEFLQEGHFENMAVILVSSDDAPEIPGNSFRAGATYFLSKKRISEPLFKPLIQGIIEKNKLAVELQKHKTEKEVMENIKTLLGTLKHEINNPLGAVLGAAYLLRSNSIGVEERMEAARLVEQSGKRIQHVLEKLSKTISLEKVTKANQKVFHIPGDKAWE